VGGLVLDTRRRSCCNGVRHMSAYVYILRCREGRRYYGSTNDLLRRLGQHRGGRVRSTKSRLPVQLIYFEECQTPEQARQRERSFKNGRTRRKAIDLLIAAFPPERLAPFA
jgi:putative endonuclease